MKKFAIGFVAIAFAVIGFSFTTKAPDQTNYVWFHVKNGTAKLCAEYLTVIPADLDLVPRTSASSTALNDLLPQTFTNADAEEFFGCPADLYVCAVGFPIQETAFELVTIANVQYWRPKTTTGELTRECRVNP